MKRFLTVFLSFLLAVSLSVCLSASDGLNACLYIETADGDVVSSNEVLLSSSGEYTFILTGINVSNPALIYIKDVNLSSDGSTPVSPFDMQVLVDSIKINGESVTLSADYRTTPNAERFDFCYYNVNGASFIEVPDEPITDIELVISVNKVEKPAQTGITLSIIPAVIALSLTVLSKKK